MSVEILEKLNRMHTDIKLTNERLQNVVVDVRAHHTTLYGNGRDGIKTYVDRLWQTRHVIWVIVIAVSSKILYDILS